MSHPIEIAITDPMEPPVDASRGLAALAMRFIRDPRDLPFLRLSGLLTVVMFPFAAYLYLRFSWWLALPYLALLFGVFLAPYTLMLHNTSHRKLFRPRYALLNHYIPTVLGPLLGQTPGTYFAHHVGMHHPENNLELDLSSTMRFQRDSLVDFLRYYGRFITCILFDLRAYFERTGRPKLARQVLVGELSWLVLAALGCAVNWRATVVVLVVPLFSVRFLMLAGNWGQHAFVDAATPGNCYRNSITCINCGYNRRAFNDGYHIGHHLSATRHWTDMPRDFLATRQQYLDEQAIVFEGIDFFLVWLFLMTKNYRALARRFVILDGRPRDEAEIIAFLKRRTARIAVTATAPLPA